MIDSCGTVHPLTLCFWVWRSIDQNANQQDCIIEYA